MGYCHINAQWEEFLCKCRQKDWAMKERGKGGAQLNQDVIQLRALVVLGEQAWIMFMHLPPEFVNILRQ
jgi:hypothetical protein